MANATQRRHSDTGVRQRSADHGFLASIPMRHLQRSRPWRFVNLDTSNGDSRGNGLKLGLGAQYSLTSNVALRGEWERYHPSAFGNKPNIDQYTVGVRVGF